MDWALGIVHGAINVLMWRVDLINAKLNDLLFSSTTTQSLSSSQPILNGIHQRTMCLMPPKVWVERYTLYAHDANYRNNIFFIGKRQFIIYAIPYQR